MTDAILAYLAQSNTSASIGDIADNTGLAPDTVRKELLRLQDDDRVLMRNGWYRLSAAERKRRDKGEPA